MCIAQGAHGLDPLVAGGLVRCFRGLPEGRTVYQRIVVGVNAGDIALRVARNALALGQRSGAEVHLVHVMANGHEDREDAEALIAGLRDGLDVTTRTHVLSGDPAEVILRVAGAVDADLVVLGSRGVAGARPTQGSVPYTVRRGARCRVQVVCAIARTAS